MAIPVMVGPGTIGAIMVSGVAEPAAAGIIVGCAALTAAAAGVGVLLFLADHVERLVGRTGLEVLSKISGLVISALAAQIILTGVKNFLQI
jgi:multiple antibiotic resistance protein